MLPLRISGLDQILRLYRSVDDALVPRAEITWIRAWPGRWTGFRRDGRPLRARLGDPGAGSRIESSGLVEG